MTEPNDASDESQVDRSGVHTRQPRKLSPQERNTLKRCELAVRKGLSTFYQLGDALRTIRNQRLYREKYSSFRTYCRSEFGFEAARARQFIAASEVFKDVADVSDTKPIHEGQMRALSPLDTEHRQLVWKAATERTPQPTKDLIEAVIEELAPASPEDQQIAIRDSAALIEHLIVQAGVLMRTVREMDYRSGLTFEQKAELHRVIQHVREAMRDVEASL